MTIHFVYVSNAHINTTSALAREIGRRLAEDYEVKLHHPNDTGVIIPAQGDILIGHPNRYRSCLFSRSFAQSGWAKRIVFAPFSLGMLEDAAAIDPLVCVADLYLAITGAYWFDAVDGSAVSHWRHKMMRCDLGVERGHFPKIKSRFNPPGRRRFLYIGNADPMRGGDFLATLADANPELEFGWIRASNSRHCLDDVVEPSTIRLNRRMRASRLKARVLSWHRPDGLQIISQYDVILSCARSEAMPCEILEAASWGLVPVTTPQCGYEADEWMSHMPLDDVAAASTVLHRLNHCDETELKERQAAGFRILERRYNWDAVSAQVRAALEGPIPRAPEDAAWVAEARANQRRLKALLLRHRTVNALGRTAHALYGFSRQTLPAGR